MNKVSVINLNGKDGKIEKEIKLPVLEILKILKKDNVLVDIYLISDGRMKLLNKKFRGRDKITTVLSFKEPRNFILPPSSLKTLGEIYLNTSKAESRKPENILRLLVHGTLHLLGYNHREKSDRMRMERKEKSVIKKLIN